MRLTRFCASAAVWKSPARFKTAPRTAPQQHPSNAPVQHPSNAKPAFDQGNVILDVRKLEI
eukprot:7476100-Lingulodinium_polyedra.AAC.1